MGRLYAIALNAFREAVRDRVLYGVLGLAVVSLLFGSSLAFLVVAEQTRILADHGVVTLSWLANLAAIFLGASFLYKEIQLRTLYVILSRPVARWHLVLGKYLGILLTATVFVALTGALLLALVRVQTDPVPGLNPSADGAALVATAYRVRRILLVCAAIGAALLAVFLARRVPRLARVLDGLGGALLVLFSVGLFAASAAFTYARAPSETHYILCSSVLVLAEVAVTSALALFFSSFSTPFVTGLFTFGAFLIGRNAGFVQELRGRQLTPELLALLRGVVQVVPNLNTFVPARESLLGAQEGLGLARFLTSAVAYAGCWSVFLLVLAVLLFRKRDLT